ncbi:MAG: helix-turn-helix protein [Actinomycetia bacterium]|nr:helix-turn-helix protein [Actinomycetes bacterium]
MARSHLACTWVGTVGADAGYADSVLPDACTDVIWNGERLFVAGPDTGPVAMARIPGTFAAGVRFLPGHGSLFFGLPAADIRDQRVDADAIWGARTVDRWRDQLEGLAPGDAARALETCVATTRVDDDRTALTDAVAQFAHESIESIAGNLGITTRTLHRRCLHAFGYGAKTLQQVLRFRRFLALAECRPQATIGQLAADAGYADQSHCHRDCVRLSGSSPSALLVSRGVRSVQDATR